MLAAAAITGIPAAADGSSPEAPEADAGAPVFGELLEEVIARYKGTRKPVFPEIDDELWDVIDSPVSSVPGRMSLPRHVTVDKPRMRLYVCNALGDTLARYPVCASRNRGQKRSEDDCRTPEGTFKVVGIYNSTDWTYKDTDDKCYGPFSSRSSPRDSGESESTEPTRHIPCPGAAPTAACACTTSRLSR